MKFDDGNGIWCGVERDKDGDMHMRVHYYCDESGRASWCPLKPLPMKREESCEMEESLMNAGWNACLEEIEDD